MKSLVGILIITFSLKTSNLTELSMFEFFVVSDFDVLLSHKLLIFDSC